MDCQTRCASSLPFIWGTEVLASSDVSLLLDLLEKAPHISSDIGRNARELVSLKILENLFRRANTASPFSEKIRLDPSDPCEDVLQRVLSKVSPQHLKSAGPEVSKWDLKPFIEHKRLNMPKRALKRLKDAILTGSPSISPFLKQQSGLPIGNLAEHETPIKDGNCSGITPKVAGYDSSLLPRDLHSQNLVRVNRKRKDTSETAAEELCTSKTYSGEKRCIMEKTTHVEFIGEYCGDGNNQFTSSKGFLENDEAPRAKQAPRCGTQVSGQNSDLEILNSKGENAENVLKGFNGLTTMNEINKTIPRIVPTADIDKFNDPVWYQEARSNIDTSKHIFLSSQCKYSQDAAADGRALHICMKCKESGKLLSCSSVLCPLVIHESCLGSDASFDTKGNFYCPFCAYSRAISKSIKVMENVQLKSKEMATFICFVPQRKSKQHSEKSFGIEGIHLQQTDDLPKSNEPNRSDGVEKASNHQQNEQAAGPSELRSDYNPPFGRQTEGSTKRSAQSLDKENQDGKSIRKMSKSMRVEGLRQAAELEDFNFQDETTFTQVSETSADVRSNKGLLSPSETELPSKQNSSASAQSPDVKELSESPDAVKYKRVQEQEKKNLQPPNLKMRRGRIPWTSEEEDKLKEGLHLFSVPNDTYIPWTHILQHGRNVFQPSRTGADLRVKWRNMCKARPNAK